MSTNWQLLDGQRLTKLSKNTMLVPLEDEEDIHGLDTTDSLHTLEINGRSLEATNTHWEHLFLLFNQLSAVFQSLMKLIGLLKVKLLQYKTKDNVVHAGLSLHLVLFPLLELLLDTHLSPSLNNNWLTVIQVVMGVMEVWWIMLSHILKPIHWNLSVIIHTLLAMVPVIILHPKVLVLLVPTMMFPRPPLDWNKLLTLELFLLPSKLTNLASNTTQVVFSHHLNVEQTLTTVFLLLVMVLTLNQA